MVLTHPPSPSHTLHLLSPFIPPPPHVPLFLIFQPISPTSMHFPFSPPPLLHPPLSHPPSHIPSPSPSSQCSWGKENFDVPGRQHVSVPCSCCAGGRGRIHDIPMSSDVHLISWIDSSQCKQSCYYLISSCCERGNFICILY